MHGEQSSALGIQETDRFTLHLGSIKLKSPSPNTNLSVNS